MLRRFACASLLVLGFGLLELAAQKAPTAGVDWPSFRGSNASGVAEGFDTPESWDVPNSKGVAWKTLVPGLGHSSPIVWGTRVCVTTVVGGSDSRSKPKIEPGSAPTKTVRLATTGEEKEVPSNMFQAVSDAGAVLEWRVMCFDKATGAVAWTQTSHRGVPSSERHQTSSHANATLATDGKHLVALFGTEGLFCYRLTDGRLLWKKELGDLSTGYHVIPTWRWGFSSSPTISDGKIIVLGDVLNKPFIAAFRVSDGREQWRTVRNDVPTFGTPVVVKHGGKTQVIVNGMRELAGYDLADGKRVWRIDGSKVAGDIPVPTPVLWRDLAIVTSSHAGSPILALRLGQVGDSVLDADTDSPKAVAWMHPRDGTYLSTPIVYNDLFYNVRANGVLAAYRASNGERLYQQRLPGRSGYTPSAVAANGKLYITCDDGDVLVVRAGEKYELIAENPIGEPISASPAISEGRIYFRTRNHLMAIAPAAVPSAAVSTTGANDTPSSVQGPQQEVGSRASEAPPARQP